MKHPRNTLVDNGLDDRLHCMRLSLISVTLVIVLRWLMCFTN